jgi:hypothetical protein
MESVIVRTKGNPHGLPLNEEVIKKSNLVSKL